MKPYDENFVPTEEGVFELSWSEYRKIKALNSSTLPYLNKSPAHAYHAINEAENESTLAQDIGHAFHCRVLEPQRYHKEVMPDWEVDFTGKAVSKNRKDYKAWRDSIGTDKIVLARKHLDHIEAMAKKVHEKKVARDLLKMGWPERTVLWKDPLYGFWCKARIDWIATDFRVADLKKTQGADKWAFEGSIRRYKYYWQAWYYLRGLRTATGIEHGPYFWIAWEDTGPIDGCVYEADPADISEAGDRIVGMLEQWAECLATGEFPGYPDEIIPLGDTYRGHYDDGLGEEIPF